jgi:MtN3 and saliva related transmembrane protein
MEWYIVGTLAALLTMFGFVPQIIKMFRTKSVKDISLLTFIQFSLGVSLWTLYGFHLGDIIIVSANSITLLILIIAIVLYFHYVRRKAVPGRTS